jgi:Tol biopolymer transport system component
MFVLKNPHRGQKMSQRNTCLIGIVVMAAVTGTAFAQVIERVSVSSAGVEADGDSFAHLYDAASGDGRFIVFESDATNLVPGDGNGVRDVFLRDRLLGTTSRVSEAAGGGDATGESRYPSISEDGRWIAFTSEAPDLVTGDTNAARDVFVYDRQTGQTTRVSMGWDGSEGNGDSRTPSISADGRYVAFRSGATNIIPGSRDSSKYIYLRDRQTGANQLVSETWDGAEENGGSWYPHISADGRHVAFISNSTDIVSFDDNAVNDLFIRDLDLEETTMVGVNTDGGAGNDHTGGFGIGADGRFVGFFSDANDLLPPGTDSNAVRDAFVRDLELEVTERVSVDSSGSEANAASGPALLDATGRYAAFWSDATNLVEGDDNVAADIFGRDRATGTTMLLTFTDTGDQADGNSSNPTLSGDGCFVVFNSTATNLVPDDANAYQDVFIAYGPAAIFADGFESGGTSRFSSTVP